MCPSSRAWAIRKSSPKRYPFRERSSTEQERRLGEEEKTRADEGNGGLILAFAYTLSPSSSCLSHACRCSTVQRPECSHPQSSRPHGASWCLQSDLGDRLLA